MLIPTVLALSKFFIENFPHISWYPYWYLGNPYSYLIGPVVPIALAIVQSAKFKVQSYDVYLGLIFLSFLIGAVGLYILLKGFGVEKRQAIFSALLYLILPASLLLLFYQNGLHHIAFGFLPWLLVLFKRYLKDLTVKRSLLLSIAISFVLLIDTSILLPLLIGLGVMLIVLKIEKERLGYMILKTTIIILLALSLATIWYTPSFWWTRLFNPSFGGLPLVKLIEFLFQLILQLLPIVLAIVFVKWRHIKLSKHLLFGLLFFSSFFFLSLVRFLFDPDFVMDWISYATELQFGGAIILGNILGSIKQNSIVQNSKLKMVAQLFSRKLKNKNYNSKWSLRSFSREARKIKIFNFKLQLLTLHFKLLIYILILLFSIVFDIWVLTKLKSQLDNSYQNRILSMLKNHVSEGERVFLSGTTVFWVNSKLNILQVRGGNDPGSIHPYWAHAAYQIREGESEELARAWLIAFGTAYVLVHEKNSSEPFHDFKHPEKFAFESVGDSSSAGFKRIGEDKGDVLYKVEGSSVARSARKDILTIPKPKNGEDRVVLSSYVATIKRPLQISFQKANKIQVRGGIEANEVLSLAVTFDPRWRLLQGRGKIVTDNLGNIIIIPEKDGEQAFTLEYTRFWHDTYIPAFVSISLFIVLLYFPKTFPQLNRLFSKFQIGLFEEDEEY